jgi:hypothetical protein
MNGSPAAAAKKKKESAWRQHAAGGGAPTNLAAPLALVPGNGITETTCACVFCCSRTVLSTVSMEPWTPGAWRRPGSSTVPRPPPGSLSVSRLTSTARGHWSNRDDGPDRARRWATAYRYEGKGRAIPNRTGTWRQTEMHNITVELAHSPCLLSSESSSRSHPSKQGAGSVVPLVLCCMRSCWVITYTLHFFFDKYIYITLGGGVVLVQ